MQILCRHGFFACVQWIVDLPAVCRLQKLDIIQLVQTLEFFFATAAQLGRS